MSVYSQFRTNAKHLEVGAKKDHSPKDIGPIKKPANRYQRRALKSAQRSRRRVLVLKKGR